MNIELNLIITFKAPFIVGSGFGIAGLVDSKSIRYEDGVPYIPATSIKGKIRAEYKKNMLAINGGKICNSIVNNNFSICKDDYVEKAYLFSWNEIPGNDSDKLLDFLKSNYGVDWIKTPKIEKTDNSKTITITVEKNIISLNLNNENTELNLIIDNDKNYKFIVTTVNGKLNIYEKACVICRCFGSEFYDGSLIFEDGVLDSKIHNILSSIIKEKGITETQSIVRTGIKFNRILKTAEDQALFTYETINSSFIFTSKIYGDIELSDIDYGLLKNTIRRIDYLGGNKSKGLGRCCIEVKGA